jgi:hypothetical protein
MLEQLVPKKGFAIPNIGNSFSLKNIAASIEYTRLADFATQSIASTASFKPMKFFVWRTPRLIGSPLSMDTKRFCVFNFRGPGGQGRSWSALHTFWNFCFWRRFEC